MLNNLRSNTRYDLSDGTSFVTNQSGFVDEISFTPTLDKMPRDSRRTAVGKEGLPTDVGGHIRACSMGGSCDRYNLFPQDANFNNSAYRKFENEIRGAIDTGRLSGSIRVSFTRADVSSARPDALLVEYSIDGIKYSKYFRNEAGQ